MNGNINVIYEDLKESSTSLGELEGTIDKVISKLETLKSDLTEKGSEHDNCFKTSISETEILIQSFNNYKKEINFMKEQCESAANAFSDTEDSVKEVTTNMWNVICNTAALAGVASPTEKNRTINFSKNREEFNNNKITIWDESTNASRSETWNRTFKFDEEGKLIEINGTTTEEAASILEDDNPGQSQQPSTTPSPGTVGYSDNGDYSNVGEYVSNTQYRRTDSSPTNNDPKTDNSKEETDNIIIIDKDKEKPSKAVIGTKPDKTIDVKDENPKTEVIVTPVDRVEHQEVTNPQPQPTAVQGGQTGGNTVVYYPQNNNTGNVPEVLTPEEPEIPEIPEEPEIPKEPDIPEDPTPTTEPTITTIPKPPTTVKETTTTKSNGGSMVIPIAAGIGAAAVAGVGAKVYLDNKRNNETEDDTEEEWTGYDDSTQDYVDGNTDDTQEEKYIARNMDDIEEWSE